MPRQWVEEYDRLSPDIAGKLDLSERTVNFHFGNILNKLAVANRGEAIAVAISRDIIAN